MHLRTRRPFTIAQPTVTNVNHTKISPHRPKLLHPKINLKNRNRVNNSHKHLSLSSRLNHRELFRMRLLRTFRSLPTCLSIRKWLSLRIQRHSNRYHMQIAHTSWLIPLNHTKIESISLLTFLVVFNSSNQIKISNISNRQCNLNQRNQDMNIKVSMLIFLDNRNKIDIKSFNVKS